MEIDSNKLKQYALFHVNRKLTGLYKQFLFVLEDIRDDKYNVKDPRVYQQTRKRILDVGNDAIREIEEHFKHLIITVGIHEDNQYSECDSAAAEPPNHTEGSGK